MSANKTILSLAMFLMLCGHSVAQTYFSSPEELRRFHRASLSALKIAYFGLTPGNSPKRIATDATGKFNPDANFNAEQIAILNELNLGRGARITFYRQITNRQLSFFVASNATDVILSFRGTETHTNWCQNGVPFKSLGGVNVPESASGKAVWAGQELDCIINALPVDKKHVYPSQLVHNGWSTSVETLWPRVVEELNSHGARGKTITITGHSLGGALTGYTSFRLLQEKDFFQSNRPHMIVTFGAPHYALTSDNGAPAQALAEYWVNTTRVISRTFDSIASAVRTAESIASNPFNITKLPEIASDIRDAIKNLERISVPRPNRFSPDFSGTLTNLISQRANQTKVFAVESRGPNGPDFVTTSWDLRGLAEYGADQVRQPINKLLNINLGKVPGAREIKNEIRKVVNSKLPFVGDFSAATFGEAKRVGTLIQVPTNKTGFDKHEQEKTYFAGLQSMFFNNMQPAQPAKPIAIASVLGSYSYQLASNDWHHGTLTQVNSTTLKWTNRAGVSWNLTADLPNRVLKTGSDNPYQSNGQRDFTLVVENNQVKGYTFGGYLYHKTGNSTPVASPSPTQDSPLTNAKVAGKYQFEPASNGWHYGEITIVNSKTLQWKNKAGVSWKLRPDYSNKKLLTGDDNPYQANGQRDFTIVLENNQVKGYTFGGYLYKRIGN